MSADNDAQEIINIAEDLKDLKYKKERFLTYVKSFQDNQQALQQYLQGKTEDQYLENYDNKINDLLDRIENANQRIIAEFETEIPIQEKIELPKPVQELIEIPTPTQGKKINKHLRKKYLQEINVKEETLKRILIATEKTGIQQLACHASTRISLDTSTNH